MAPLAVLVKDRDGKGLEQGFEEIVAPAAPGLIGGSAISSGWRCLARRRSDKFQRDLSAGIVSKTDGDAGTPLVPQGSPQSDKQCDGIVAMAEAQEQGDVIGNRDVLRSWGRLRVCGNAAPILLPDPPRRYRSAARRILPYAK
ncbi:hypothetical protein LCM4579_11870 [Ensifer sp. LCM 4579]|nr:hypothetical protein LCM4579_11870 [Ensifer sp. LCM 4579]